MDAQICNHPDESHTVWYWLDDGGPPIPMSARLDNVREARRFADRIIAQNNTQLRWIKIFRTDNEAYTCFRWENPVTSSNSIKVNVDTTAFSSTFKTVADRFDRHWKAIKILMVNQLILAIVFLVHFVSHWID